jgi:hypothetical protein
VTALAAKAPIYPARPKKDFTLPVKAGVVIYPGAKVAMKNGLLQPVTAALDLKHFCTATNTSTVDNTDGSDGDLSCNVEFDDPKTLVYCKNDVTSPIVAASFHIGQDAYAVDDSGVVSADGTNRTRIGTPWIVVSSSDALGQRPGVYVEMDTGGADGQQSSLDLTAATEITIAAGVATVTQSHHTIDNEADAASDNLDSFAGMVAGQLYVFSPASASRTVVVRDASVSSGNIRTPFAQSISLAEEDDYAIGISDGTDLTIVAFRTLAANGGGAGVIIGLLSALNTTDKASVIAAINELQAPVSQILVSRTASVGAKLTMAEGTDNGANKVTIATPNTLAGDVTVTLPTGDLDLGDVPAMQSVDATLVNGTVTISSGIVVAATSEVIARPKGAITGSTNFGCVQELVASRSVPGTIVIQAVGNDGVIDADAAGVVRVTILTPAG